MTATFFGGAVGTVVSGWLMTHFGWTGIVCFGIALGLIAAAIHWVASPRQVAPHAHAPHAGAPGKAAPLSSNPD